MLQFADIRPGVSEAGYPFHLKRADGSCGARCGTAKSRAIKRPLVATIGINEENLRFDDLPRDREKVLSKNFRFLFSILEEGGKKALASKLGIDPTTVSWPRTRD